jgi:hypothetical protein
MLEFNQTKQKLTVAEEDILATFILEYAWEVECQRLASTNMPKRSWPKRPMRPSLPMSRKLSREEEEDGEDNGVDE